MTFEENPFRVLNVSICDDKETIIERADDLSFADPNREEIIEHARDILLNPRKRIAAEFWELVGNNILSDVNVSIDIITLDKKFSDLDAKEICWQINTARKKSKFPSVQDTAAIKDELKNLREEISKEIQNVFKNFSHSHYVKQANKIAEDAKYLAANEEFFGVIVEDFFDSYRLQMTPFLDDMTEQIISLPSKFEFKFKAEFSQFLYELEPNFKAFTNAMRPIDKFSEALGTNDFAATEKIFYTVRDVAIKLFNEKDLIDYPLEIIHLLQSKLYYLPHLAELIRKDIQFLEEAKKRRPTQAFLNANAALENILAALKDNLHFEKDFGRWNINFYINVFKPRHEVKLLDVMSKLAYKPEERKYLNEMAATIYILVGNAVTWTLNEDWGLAMSLNSRLYLTLELFQKALAYAEATGDAELISTVRKRVDRFQNIVTEKKMAEQEKISRKESEEASGCLWLIFIFIIFCILMH